MDMLTKRRGLVVVTLMVLLIGLISVANLGAAVVNITFVSMRTSPIERQATQAVVDAFEKANPGIKVSVEYSPWSVAQDKLIPAIINKTPPDCSTMGSSWLGLFAAMDAFYPLDQYIAKWEEKDLYSKSAWDAVTWNGKRMGIHLDAGTMLLVYNKDMFVKAGLDPNKPPQTWDEFLQYAKALTIDTNKDGTPDQYGFSLVGSGTSPCSMPLLIIMSSYNKATDELVFTKDGKIAFDRPECVQAMQYWVDLFRVHKVVPPSAPIDDQLAQFLNFKTGKAAMIFSEPRGLADFKGIINYGTAEMPAGPARRTTTVGGVLLTVYKASKHVDEAWKFISFFAGYEGSKIYCSAIGTFPDNKKTQKEPFVANNPDLVPAINSLEYAKPMPFFAAWGTLEIRDFPNILQQALLGHITPAQAVKNLAAATLKADAEAKKKKK